MLFRVLADATVVLHLAFVVFVVAGGLLVAGWPRLAWLHLPAVAWAAFVEFDNRVCPLTPLEIWLREQAGLQAYSTDFIAHYVLPVLYPESLTRAVQFWLGGFVIAVNAGLYAGLVLRIRRRRRAAVRAAKH